MTLRGPFIGSRVVSLLSRTLRTEAGLGSIRTRDGGRVFRGECLANSLRVVAMHGDAGTKACMLAEARAIGA